MELHFEIENQCLLKCRHCSSYAVATGSGMEYAVQDMIRFLNLFYMNDKDVFLTGGEPMLHPYIVDMIGCIKRHAYNTKIGLFTSGIITNEGALTSVSDRFAFDLAEQGVECCYVSVYSDEPMEHDWMTGVTGSFELTRQSIQALNKNGIDVRFNTVITAANKDHIFNIVKLAEEWNVSEVRLLKLISHGRAKGAWDSIGIEEQQYRDAVKRVIAGQNSVTITVSGMEDVIPCRRFCNVGECPAGKELWYVTYKGDIFPCASVKNNPLFCAGNITDDMLEYNIEQYMHKMTGNMLCRKY